MKRLSVGLLMLLIWWGCLGAPAAVLACTEPIGGLPRYTAAERTQAAMVVLEGTIIKGEEDLTGYVGKITVDVQQYLKGRGPGTVMIDGFGPKAICRSEVDVGDHLIFYVAVDGAQNFHAHYLNKYDSVEPAIPQTLAEIQAATGHAPTPPDSSSLPPISSPGPETNPPDQGPGRAIWLAGLVIVLSGGLILVRRRMRRAKPS